MIGFTTGAFIESQKIEDKWYWIVTEFENDTFINGIDVPNIQVISDTEDGLTGMNNYRIIPTNEGQSLNYSEIRATEKEARAKAQKIANNLQKIFASATILVEIEEIDSGRKIIIEPTQDSE